MRVLVTGATGYVGGRLAPRLAAGGYEVRCLSRSARRLADRPWASHVDVVEGDVRRPDTLGPALDGVEVAYYLIHSLGGPDFEARDRQAATAFAAAARAAGVRRLVYLGGPVPTGRHTSAHLRSRQEVAQILLDSGVPTVVLRAAVILGSGSTSFEMLRYLTERLPVMLAPGWVRNHVQPIAVRDVLHYLVHAAHLPGRVHRDFDIGGPEVVTFRELMRRYARIADLPPRLVIPVRALTPWLSSWWVGLVTPVPGRLARPLVESLVHESVSHEHAIAEHIPDPPGGLTDVDTGIRLALARLSAGEVDPDWPAAPAPSDPLPSDPGWTGGIRRVDERSAAVAADPEQLWSVIEQVAADAGPWRVHRREPGRMLRLRSTLPMPGRAWLEMWAEPRGDGAGYRQRLVFVPHGLTGQAYWLATAPVRASMLAGITRTVTRRAGRVGPTGPAEPGPGGTGAAPDRPVPGQVAVGGPPPG